MTYFRQTDIAAARREGRALLRRCADEYSDVVLDKGGAGRPDWHIGEAAKEDLRKYGAEEPLDDDNKR